MNYSTHSSGVLHISIDIEFASFSTSGLDQTNISQLTTLWEERDSVQQIRVCVNEECDKESGWLTCTHVVKGRQTHIMKSCLLSKHC